MNKKTIRALRKRAFYEILKNKKGFNEILIALVDAEEVIIRFGNMTMGGELATQYITIENSSNITIGAGNDIRINETKKTL